LYPVCDSKRGIRTSSRPLSCVLVVVERMMSFAPPVRGTGVGWLAAAGVPEAALATGVPALDGLPVAPGVAAWEVEVGAGLALPARVPLAVAARPGVGVDVEPQAGASRETAKRSATLQSARCTLVVLEKPLLTR
jgi:hypothetical protein